MLKVKTYLDRSTIPNAGMGCFAAEHIPKGQVIWEMDPYFDRIFTDEDLARVDELTREFLTTYAYRHNGLYYLCIDNARFFNHSETPNTLDPLNEYKTYALRDIEEGEEILSNYATFGFTEGDLVFNTQL